MALIDTVPQPGQFTEMNITSPLTIDKIDIIQGITREYFKNIRDYFRNSKRLRE